MSRSQDLLGMLDKNHDLKTFLKKIGEWALEPETFSGLRIRPLPTAPGTKAYIEWRDSHARFDYQSEFYKKHPEVIAFATQQKHIIDMNRANMLWLKELVGYVPEQTEKINQRLLEFKEFFHDAVKETFKGSYV